ncbi:MAG: hypothetical protein ACLTL8_09495 [Bifidobacterium pseudocatenulatum]
MSRSAEQPDLGLRDSAKKHQYASLHDVDHVGGTIQRGRTGARAVRLPPVLYFNKNWSRFRQAERQNYHGARQARIGKPGDLDDEQKKRRKQIGENHHVGNRGNGGKNLFCRICDIGKNLDLQMYMAHLLPCDRAVNSVARPIVVVPLPAQRSCRRQNRRKTGEKPCRLQKKKAKIQFTGC